MFSKVYLVASTLIAVAVAQAPLQCYQGVPTSAGPATDCSRFVNTFCDAAAAVPAVRIDDSVSRCFNLPDAKVCDFIAWNTFTRNVPPSAANCKSVLNKVISQCVLGGYGQVGPNAYTFTVDVNHGQCGHDVHGGS
ncbi:hypothetical protein AGABI2DRAFT_117525 [Agaricus bisporus var. bisporus H97]|uniref:hypothetical protein n=1 Tax=Agaricus bisporus var. bisporus (strain H97 / ATCC MYA-4626 / FGSC 10389) TaxID=936046 RepID=UPI00029F6282|nr:hypothetical protein AGABI2DRAFT_117525 [Agaricus bisporus var. bisporus H97]EKV48722.1 hypothetical protein AGABI2DRAFT_117525 [Agaricus bisporus var. bisporus H97]